MGTAAGTNALTTLLNTIRAMVRDELYRQLLQIALVVASSALGIGASRPSQLHHQMSMADALVLEGLAGEVC